MDRRPEEETLIPPTDFVQLWWCPDNAEEPLDELARLLEIDEFVRGSRPGKTRDRRISDRCCKTSEKDNGAVTTERLFVLRLLLVLVLWCPNRR